MIMGEVYFYHLIETPLEEALPMILSRARDRGWRIEVRGRDQSRMEALDLALWQGPDDSFLPHGLAGGPQDDDQPILLTTKATAGFDCLMTVDGAELSAAEVETSTRTCVIFDGADADALDAARGQWKTLTGAGCSAQYWAQDSGRWTKKAESKRDQD